jgi:hypothetical protein
VSTDRTQASLDETALAALAAEAVVMETTVFDLDAMLGPRSPSYRILSGRLPIVLSAPHAVQQRRCSGVMPPSLHRSEPYTGPLAIQLNRLAGAWAIYAARPSYSDPNHAAFSTYKRFGLHRVAIRAAPRLILDLHGTQTSEFDIAIGTSPVLRAGRRQVLIDLVVARLTAEFNGRVVVDPPAFSANNPHTVTAHCWSTLEIPSVQLEISRALRRPRHDPVGYGRLLRALYDLIGAFDWLEAQC